MKPSKRSRMDIYSDILSSLRLETSGGKKGSPTRVSQRANLPYDRFQRALDELVELKMVCRNEGILALTKKGIECLEEFEKIDGFLRRMGFQA